MNQRPTLRFVASSRLALLGALLASSMVGCGKSKAAAPPPAKPSTGAPIAFEALSVTPGAGEKYDGEVNLKAYNFSDKKVAGYSFLIRYRDASGQVLKVSVGTPFEKDFDSTSAQGPDMVCEPASWCAFTLDHLSIPKGAVKATVLAARVRAIAADGVKFEPTAIFELQDQMTWPAGVD